MASGVKGSIVHTTTAAGLTVRSFVSEEDHIFLQLKEKAQICESRVEVHRTNFDQIAISFNAETKDFFKDKHIPATQMSPNLLMNQKLSVSIHQSLATLVM